MASGSRPVREPASPESVSSAFQRSGEEPVVSGLDLSPSRSSPEISGAAREPASPVAAAVGLGSVAPAAGSAAPVQGRAAQDRLGWLEPAPSRKSLWRKRKAAQRADAAAAGPSRPVPPDLYGLCFKCFEPGHWKAGCPNKQVCLRCGEEDHEARDCVQPRSPRPEEDLRREILAKRARRGSPPAPGPAPNGELRTGIGGQHRGPAAVETARRPLSPPVPSAPAPVVAFRAREGEPEDLPGVAPLCVVRRSATMRDLEHRMRFAMVAYVGGARPSVSCDQVRHALRSINITEEFVSVHKYLPEDFLLVFANAECRNTVAALPSLPGPGFTLFFRQWNRQAQATHVTMRSKVSLVVEGIPPHAWDLDVVEDLLGTSCVVEEMAPESSSREDLSTFKLTAWTSEVDSIPPARTLVIPEPESPGAETPSPARESSDASRSPTPVMSKTEVETLRYKVLIHVDRVEEVEVVDPEGYWCDPGSSDSGRSGLPDSGDRRGFGGGRRTSRRPPWRLGVPDRRGGSHTSPTGANGQQRSYRQVVVGQLDWKIPPISARCVSSPLEKGSALGSVRAESSGAKGALSPSAPFLPGADKFSNLPRRDPKETGSVAARGRPGMRPTPTMVYRRKDPCSGLERTTTAAQTQGNSLGAAVLTTGPTSAVLEVLDHTTSGSSSLEASAENTLEGVDVAAEAEVDATSDGSRSEEEFFEVSLSVEADEDEEGPVLGQETEVLGPNPGGPLTQEVAADTTEVHGPTICGPLTQEERRVEDDVAVAAELAVVPEPCSNAAQAMELSRLKTFCANVLKTLAPPLLREVESSTTTASAPPSTPFTPRMRTRRSRPPIPEGKPLKKASASENVLLKALGVVPENMVVDEAALQDFKGLFDSPMKDEHLRIIAGIFGKAMPPMEDLLAGGSPPVCAH